MLSQRIRRLHDQEAFSLMTGAGTDLGELTRFIPERTRRIRFSEAVILQDRARLVLPPPYGGLRARPGTDNSGYAELRDSRVERSPARDALFLNGPDRREVRRKSTNKTNRFKILFVCADATGLAPLRVQDEFRKIQAELLASPLRDELSCEVSLATRPADLSRSILATPRPRILHLSGHGLKDGSFGLQSDSGNIQPVAGSAIAALLAIAAGDVEVVVLNACYSIEQAASILNRSPTLSE